MNIELIRLISLISLTISGLVYVSYILIKYGILKSISISYYSLPKNKRWVFQLFMWSLGLGIAASGYSICLIASGACFCIVGTTPTIKDTKKRWIPILHSISSITGMILLIIGLSILYNPYLIAFFIVLYMAILLAEYFESNNNNNVNSSLFWIEVITILLYVVLMFIKI